MGEEKHLGGGKHLGEESILGGGGEKHLGLEKFNLSSGGRRKSYRGGKI